jgi:DNA polymerase III epsilon subunit-like protein
MSSEKSVALNLEDETHRCQYCSVLSMCYANKCQCFIFGKSFFCNRGCRDDYVNELRIANMKLNCVVPCDLHILFDLETSGLDVDLHEVVELGAMVDRVWISKSGNLKLMDLAKDQSEGNALEFSTLIKNTKPISKSAVDIHNITEKMLSDKGVTKEVAMSRFFSWISSLVTKRPAVVYLTAYNAHGFDMKFLKALAAEANQEPPNFIHFTVSDSLKACRRAIGISGLSMKLEDVYNRMVNTDTNEKDVKQAHRAMEDNYMQMSVIAAMTDQKRKLFYDGIIEQSIPLNFPYEKPKPGTDKTNKQKNEKKSLLSYASTNSDDDVKEEEEDRDDEAEEDDDNSDEAKEIERISSIIKGARYSKRKSNVSKSSNG